MVRIAEEQGIGGEGIEDSGRYLPPSPFCKVPYRNELGKGAVFVERTVDAFSHCAPVLAVAEVAETGVGLDSCLGERRRSPMSLLRASSSVRVPVGRQPIASMRASQPMLVCGPCLEIPPKTVQHQRGGDRSCEEDGEAGAEELAGVGLHKGRWVVGRA